MKNHTIYKTFAFLLIAGSALLPRPAHADITSNLFGWWKFDEGSGTTAADSSGNGNTGTLVNGATWVAGKIGSNAVSVANGGGGSGSYVSTANTTPAANEDISLSAWIYPTDLTGQSGANAIIQGGASGWGQLFVASDGHLIFVDRLAGQHEYMGATIPLNTWTMVAVTCHDTAGAGSDVVTMYINGSQVLQDTGSNFCFDNFPNNYVIGTYGGVPGSFGWTGYIDDVRIYDGRTLSPSDISDLFALGSSVAPPPTPSLRSFITKVRKLFTIRLGKKFQIK